MDREGTLVEGGKAKRGAENKVPVLVDRGGTFVEGAKAKRGAENEWTKIVEGGRANTISHIKRHEVGKPSICNY